MHHGVFQASRYPRCIPGHQSFPNPPTPQPQPETNTTLKQSDNQNRQITANASIHTNCSPASQCTVWRPEWAAGEGEHRARLPLHFLLGPTDDTHPSPEERPLETLPVVWEACVLKHDRKHCVEFVHPLPAYLHSSKSLHVQWVVFKKLSKGSAPSGIVTS